MSSTPVASVSPAWELIREHPAMTESLRDLGLDDWQRIRDALRYQGSDLHHRSFAVTASRLRQGRVIAGK